MARTQTIVQLSDELVAELDAEAVARGVSRSALIREAIDRLLDSSRDASITRAIVEGYRRVPPGEPDEWGSLERSSDRATAEVAQRLDAEDASSSLTPW